MWDTDSFKKDEDATEEKLLKRRELDDNLIVKGEDFCHKFIQYRSFFNEMWGKLYRADLFLHGQDWEYMEEKFFYRFLPDTLFTFDNLSKCHAIGILSGTSHKFYQFEKRKATNATAMVNANAANTVVKTSSGNNAVVDILRRPKKNRYDVYYTYDVIVTFLRTHGEIDAELYEYMQAVLFGWLGDIYSRTLLLTTDEEKLTEHVGMLVFNPKFDELMGYQDSGKYGNLRGYKDRKEFCILLRNMLAYQPIIRNREGYLECSEETNRKLERLIEKLDATIRDLSNLQSGGSETC